MTGWKRIEKNRNVLQSWTYKWIFLLNISFNHIIKIKTPQPKPFFEGMGPARQDTVTFLHTSPTAPVQVSFGPPGHRPHGGPAQRSPALWRATPSALCAPSAPLPLSRPRPAPVRLRTGEHVAAAEPEQQWRRAAAALLTPCLPRGSPAPSPRRAKPTSLWRLPTVTCECGRPPTTGCTKSTCLPRTSVVPAPAWPGRQRGCRPR